MCVFKVKKISLRRALIRRQMNFAGSEIVLSLMSNSIFIEAQKKIE